MLIDANILLFAVDASSRFHGPARRWFEDVMNGDRRVGLPWSSLGAFLRIATNPRAARRPLTAAAAWGHVEAWLAHDRVWIPQPTARHAEILGGLVRRYELTGNLITDAQLAALASEHGLTVVSADTDFARFAEIEWFDPLGAGATAGPG